MQLIKPTIRGQVRKIIKPQGFVRSMKACDDTMHTPHSSRISNKSLARSEQKSGPDTKFFHSFYVNETIPERKLLFRTSF